MGSLNGRRAASVLSVKRSERGRLRGPFFTADLSYGSTLGYYGIVVMGMVIILDTNVLLSGLKSSRG